MGDDFDKRDEVRTELVIVRKKSPPRGETAEQMLEMVKVEIRKRPQMRVVQVMNLALGDGRGLLLLFEERDDSLAALRMDINQIRETIERIGRTF